MKKRIMVCLLLALCVLCLNFDRTIAMTWDEFQNLVLDGSATELEKAMKRDNVYINAVNEETGANLLTTALMLGANMEIISYLVKAGADVNDSNNGINLSMLNLALAVHGEDSSIYKIMLDTNKLSAQNTTPTANSENNSSTPKISVVVSDMNPSDIYAKQINPNIRKAGFGTAIFGESMRIGTAYDNFYAVMESISSRKIQEALQPIGFKYNPPSKEFHSVQIHRLIKSSEEDFRLLSFRFGEDDNGMFWDGEVYAYPVLLKSDSQSARERENAKNEVDTKKKTIEGCLELCKPYAPLIIDIDSYEIGIKLRFYYDSKDGIFTLIRNEFSPRIFSSLGYQFGGEDSFVSCVLQLSDALNDSKKIKDFYKIGFKHYWKDVTNGYAVI